MTQEQERKQALKQHLEHTDVKEMRTCEYDDTCIVLNNGEEYQVLTNDEADEEWERNLDSYIDECLEIPDHVKPYFDEDKWKDDARIDGRGHSINHYDGTEEEEEVNGTTYYIYRRN